MKAFGTGNGVNRFVLIFQKTRGRSGTNPARRKSLPKAHPPTGKRQEPGAEITWNFLIYETFSTFHNFFDFKYYLT
jgi:hypothetical protein